MKDDKIDYKIQLVGELITLWSELQKVIDEALEAPDITEQMEDRCMTVKTRIAQRKQLAKELIGEAFNCNAAMVKVLLGIPTLDLLKRQSPIIISNLRNVWHDAFIALNELAGNLRIQREEQAKSGKSGKSKKGVFARLGGRA